MTGDLILKYERMAVDEDAGLVPLSGAAIGALSRVAAAWCDDGGCEFEMDRAVAFLPEAQHDQARLAFRRALPRCESPIERRLLPWLICQPYSLFMPPKPRVLLPGEAADLEDHAVAVVPQLQIGRRRVDFALAARRGGPIRFIVIECDGEAYHKDVHADVARDAELMRHDRVLDVHFISGRDIWRDAAAAARAAAHALTHGWSKTNPVARRKIGGLDG